MLRLSRGATLISVLAFSFSLAACASTSSGGAGGNYYGTGGSGAGTSGGSGGSGGSATGGSGGSATGGSGGSAMGGSGGSAMGGSGGSAMGGSSGSGGSTGGTGGSCSKPGKLYSTTIYCPFSAPAGGKNLYCTPGTQHCCEGLTSADVSTCDPLATACTTGWTDWVCQKDSDCGSGQQCCAAATLVKNTNTSCANYASKFHATKCETTCAAGEIHMCTSNSDCTGSGQTCLPFSTKGAQVGGCYPQ